MPIPLGILAVAGAGGGGAAGDFQLIETVALSGTQTSVTFSNIPNTFRHLQIRCITKVTDSANNNAQSVSLQFNSDTGSNYAHHRLRGNGSDVTSESSSSQTSIVYGLSTNSGSSTPSQLFSPAIIDILDYANSSKNKTTKSLVGGLAPAASNFAELRSGLWVNTSIITSIRLFSSSNWVSGSRFSLYGIKG